MAGPTRHRKVAAFFEIKGGNVRYHLQERAWSLSGAFTIRDDEDNVIFEVQGGLFGDDLSMYDVSAGQEVVQIQKHLFGGYDIYRNGEHWASAHELFHFFNESFAVECDDGTTLQIDGDLWDWNFEVCDGSGDLVGQVSRDGGLFGDNYTVDVAPGIDAPCILALVIIIEKVRERHNS
ncbi:MAG: LURP-one-related family protein [Ktedonobacteraceae bacterium]|nr:LURP-one-related family protein [Ktedonobacteraceae bacterium]